MPRAIRQKSQTGIYHLILRGNNKQVIFEDDEDAKKFLETLKNYKNKAGYQIYAYCLMSNHIHLLIKEGIEDLSKIMRRIGPSFVYWYNLKYERIGHLFQDRYKSEAIENERYLLAVLRYIHQNPTKANIVKNVADYKWSSYKEYLGKSELVDQEFILRIFNENRQKAISEFVTFHAEEEPRKWLDLIEKIRIKDEEAVEIIKMETHLLSVEEMQEMPSLKKNHFLSVLKKKGLSTRQIARITGIPRHIILKT